MKFDFSTLRFDDRQTFLNFVGDMREPDLVIAPYGLPYLYRWHITPRGGPANIYFHIQVADDPERPLHNHPWDNVSVILAGGYKETMCMSDGPPDDASTFVFIRRAGDVVHRRAGWSHRLELLYGNQYAMTLFTTGPKIREWGFWYPDGFRHWQQVVEQRGDLSVQTDGGKK